MQLDQLFEVLKPGIVIILSGMLGAWLLGADRDGMAAGGPGFVAGAGAAAAMLCAIFYA